MHLCSVQYSVTIKDRLETRWQSNPSIFFRGVPRSDKMYNPSSVFWVYLVVSYRLLVARKSPRGGAQTISTSSFRYEGAAAVLQAPHLICKGEASRPLEETHSGLLCHSFSHYPDLGSIGEGYNVDQPTLHPPACPSHAPFVSGDSWMF